MISNRNILYQGSIFRCHLSFWGCAYLSLPFGVLNGWCLGCQKKHLGFKNAPELEDASILYIYISIYIYKYAYIYIYIYVCNKYIYICIDSIFPFVKIIIVQASKPFIPSRRSRGAVYSGQIHQNLLPSDGWWKNPLANHLKTHKKSRATAFTTKSWRNNLKLSLKHGMLGRRSGFILGYPVAASFREGSIL